MYKYKWNHISDNCMIVFCRTQYTIKQRPECEGDVTAYDLMFCQTLMSDGVQSVLFRF